MRLRVQWLVHLNVGLPRRRRLSDEPNQGHPPAIPAALQRKHPVLNARQQLRPKIARPPSGPRGADNHTHLLWLGCLTPRRQLPAGLRRHRRPPRRVRRQYPKVAVPMLARRWYQRRYPISKIAGAHTFWKNWQGFRYSKFPPPRC